MIVAYVGLGFVALLITAILVIHPVCCQTRDMYTESQLRNLPHQGQKKVK